MAKLKKSKPSTPEQKFSSEDLEAGLTIVHREYFMQILALLSHDQSLSELNFARCPIVTPQGGEYLVSILHISGPKINLRDMDEKATEEEKKLEVEGEKKDVL